MSADIPNTYRFFVPPDTVGGDSIVLTDAALAHQLGRVLRLRPGSRVLLLDGQGMAYVVTLTELGRERIGGHIEQRLAAGGEPRIEVTLYTGLMRPERFEWVLQKGTELGVTAFVPVLSERSLPAAQASPRKLERWQRIVREAAEQSCRGRLPRLLPPQPWEHACQQAARADLALVLWEAANDDTPAHPLRALLCPPAPTSPDFISPQTPAAPASVAVLSGPEGGITQTELTSATGHGIMPTSLGARILRAETAPVVAAAILFYEFDEA